ncbi:MAG TPA: Tm-1-like ATP-binding domain-containing protein [Acidobacteriota bacterium]|nr:Tm-1-like ATP-binding domain-containing protein [Acidobacteriota bacterium]
MSEKPKVLLIVTLDSKAAEAGFMRKCLEDCGLEVCLLDPGVRSASAGAAEISPDEIAAAAGKTMAEVRALNHEAKCMEIMTAGAVHCAQEEHRKAGFSGIIGIGGSLGTDLATAVMRSFPFGLPKVMVSTMASGMTRPFVGTKDIMMMPSVCDVTGLNVVTRRVFENSARALAGMAHGYTPSSASERPMAAISTLGATEKCCAAIRKALEQAGYEVMVFHTQGVGGIAMDEAVREQNVSIAINLSLIEVSDYLSLGLYSGGPDRCKASLEKGIPTIFAPGNIDFIVAGPIEDARARYPGRRYHIHNPELTAVRAGAEEFRRTAEYMAGLIREAKGPAAFFVPLLGFSGHDSEQGHLHDPSLPPVFAEHLKKALPVGVPVHAMPCHINDEPFARKIIDQVFAFQ